MNTSVSSGVAHAVPLDLKHALTSDSKVLGIWNTLTPLARNEWICWVLSVKQEKTRKNHIKRVCSQLKKGSRRPCCWIGCIHRKDKAISLSAQHILKRK